MSLFGLVYTLRGDIAEAKLNRVVAVVLGCFLLNDDAGARFNDRYGNDLAVLVENLGHADFLSD